LVKKSLNLGNLLLEPRPQKTMRLFLRLIGLALLLAGVYFLGQNIYFSTNVYPYWWRGIAADFSILSLTLGILMLFVLPRSDKALGWVVLGIGIFLIFLSSRAILNPTSLWQFCLSMASFVGGYQLFTTGRLNI
jgi:hypothetical protein